MTELQKKIIRQIQINGNLSRKALVTKLNVTPAAISQNTKILIDNKIIEECFSVQTDRAGRKEVLIRIKKDAFYCLGIDIDKKINLSQVDGYGNPHPLISFISLEECYRHIKKLNLDKCLAIAISKKGFYSLDKLSTSELSFYKKIENLRIQVTMDNNVACLAYAHKFYNIDDNNFLLIKYGPGVGSCCMIHNKILKSPLYPTYEMGKLIINLDGTTLEDKISYESLKVNEKNVIDKIIHNKDLKEKLFKYLSYAIINANTLLQLDRIILSGEIFQSKEIFNELIRSISKNANIDKKRITLISHYKEFNDNKAALTALYYSMM